MINKLVNWFLLFIKLGLIGLICLFYLGCRQTTGQKQVIIEGKLADAHSFLENQKLYLINQETKDTEDSSLVINGRFQFTADVTKNIPRKVSLSYRTGNPAWPYLLISLQNPYLKKVYESSFYLEQGTTHLRVDTTFKPAGMAKIAFAFTDMKPQTEVAYKHLSFRPSTNLPSDSKEYNSKLVNQYAYSLDLLTSLYLSRGALSQEELTHLLSLFDHALQTTPQYKNLLFYTRYTSKNEIGFPDQIKLMKPNRSLALFNLDSTKYNLVVFWASWCVPCRKEIPQIKTLYAVHKDRVRVTSISIDKREGSWIRALEQEQMPWDQFLVEGDTSYVKLDKKYNLSAIPVWLLLDSAGFLLDRQMGMSTDENAINQRVMAQLTK